MPGGFRCSWSASVRSPEGLRPILEPSAPHALLDEPDRRGEPVRRLCVVDAREGERRDDQSCHRVDEARPVRGIALRLVCGDAARDRRVQLGAVLGDGAGDLLVVGDGCAGRVDEQAAVGGGHRIPSPERVAEPGEVREDRIPIDGIGLQRAKPRADDVVEIALHRRVEESPLGSESVVDAGSAQSGGVFERGDGCVLVAALPEQRPRGVHDRIPIEALRA